MREYRNADCTVDNLCFTLQQRVYIATPPWAPPPVHYRIFKQASYRLAKQLSRPLTEDQVGEALAKFPPGKRKLYGDALKQPYDPSRSECTAFVKDEWTPVKAGKTWKPRVIQFRSPGYLAHLLHLYKPIEHAFYKGRYLFNRSQKYTCAKGMNPHHRITYIRKLIGELNDPFVVDLDGSAFDAHVVPQAIDLEWKFYLSAAKEAGWPPDKLALLRRYWASQRRNKCKARCKDGFVSYTVHGNRMSGDLNTGCGNSVLMSGYIASVFASVNVPDESWRMLVDGDDAIVLVERQFVNTFMAAVQPTMLGFSQEVKVGAAVPVSVDRMEGIEFCQSRPVCVHGEWRLVRSPFKVVNCYIRSFRWSKDDKLMKRYFASISPPEMIINADVPILDKFFVTTHAISGSAKPLDSVSRNFWRRTVLGSELMSYQRQGTIDGPTRESFARAFGISPEEQLLLEGQIDTRRGKYFYFE